MQAKSGANVEGVHVLLEPTRDGCLCELTNRNDFAFHIIRCPAGQKQIEWLDDTPAAEGWSRLSRRDQRLVDVVMEDVAGQAALAAWRRCRPLHLVPFI